MKKNKFKMDKSYRRDKSPIKDKPAIQDKRLLNLVNVIQKAIDYISKITKKLVLNLKNNKETLSKLFLVKKDIVRTVIKNSFKSNMTEEQQNHVNTLTDFIVKNINKISKRDIRQFDNLLKLVTKELTSNEHSPGDKPGNIEKSLKFLSENPQMFNENLDLKSIEKDIKSFLITNSLEEITQKIAFTFHDTIYSEIGGADQNIYDELNFDSDEKTYYQNTNNENYVNMRSNSTKSHTLAKTYEPIYENTSDKSNKYMLSPSKTEQPIPAKRTSKKKPSTHLTDTIESESIANRPRLPGN